MTNAELIAWGRQFNYPTDDVDALRERYNAIQAAEDIEDDE